VAASLVAASGYCGEVDVCERVDKVGGAMGAPAGSPALGSPFRPTAFPEARTHIPIAGEGLDGGVVVVRGRDQPWFNTVDGHLGKRRNASASSNTIVSIEIKFFCYKTLEKNQFTRNIWRTLQELSVTRTGGTGERSREGAREGGARARAQYRQAIAIACLNYCARAPFWTGARQGAPPSDYALGPLSFKSDWVDGALPGKGGAQIRGE
jgi:hypothetical protein